MADLSALSLQLSPLHADTIPVWLGRTAQAWFLASLQAIDPALSKIIHDQAGHKPYTLSTLKGLSGREVATLSPQQTYTLRVTTLHPDLTRLTLNHLLPQWLNTPLVLHDQPFRTAAIYCDTSQDPTSGQTTYEQLLQQAPRRLLKLTFDAPTTFKKTSSTKGVELYQPLPEPRLVLRSLYERWQHFSPIPLLPNLLEYIEEGVSLESYRLHTQRVSFERANRGILNGFMGHITYQLGSHIPTQARQQIQALGDFALFSGVGIKTTMGLGQVWRSPEGKPEHLSINT